MTHLFDVLGLDPSDTLVWGVALALPILVFLTLLVLLRMMSRAKRRRAAAARVLDTPAGLSPAPFAATELQEPAAKILPAGPSHSKLESQSADPVEHVMAQISATVAKPALAPHYLELALLHRARGDEPAALAALRLAAGLAAQHGPRTAHAEARLELAEAAFNGGDLTGACEQWQMARTALHEEGDKAAHARVEKRMRDNGCPTDWVLTDF